MPILLHILTKSDDSVAQAVIAVQSQSVENQIEVVDLTQAEPDYEALVERIFRADSVEVW